MFTKSWQGLMKIIYFNRLHVILAVFLAAWTWSSILDTAVPWYALLPIGLGAASVYLINRLTDFREDVINCPDETRQAMAHRVKILVTGIGVMVLALGFTYIYVSIEGGIVLSFVALGIGYGLPLPFLSNHRPKQLLLLKNVISIIGWTLATVLYPVIISLEDISTAWLWFAITHMAFVVFAVEITWDMRDSAGDKVAAVATIPNRLGIRRSSIVLLGIAGVASTIVGLSVVSGLVPMWWLWLDLIWLPFLIIALQSSRTGVVTRKASHWLVTVLALGGVLFSILPAIYT